jgi:hypothetical protein
LNFTRAAPLGIARCGSAPAPVALAAYQWAEEMDDTALTALGFEGRDGFQYNYDLCLMVEYGPRAKDALN